MSRAYMPKSKTQDHETPDWLFKQLHNEFSFTIDAAANEFNHKLDRYWSEKTDGLKQSWEGESIFINPPFAVVELRRWVKRAWKETRNPGTTVVLLVPVKSDQDWWHNYALRTEIRFIRGRIVFSNNKSSYPGPVAVLVFKHDIKSNVFKTIYTPTVKKK